MCLYIYANVEQKELHNFKKIGSAFFKRKNEKKDVPNEKYTKTKTIYEIGNGWRGGAGDAIPLEI